MTNRRQPVRLRDEPAQNDQPLKGRFGLQTGKEGHDRSFLRGLEGMSEKEGDGSVFTLWFFQRPILEGEQKERARLEQTL